MRSQRMEKGDQSKPHPVSDRQKKNGFALGCNRASSGSVSFVFLPAEIPKAKFIKKMEEKRFTVYTGNGPLKSKNMIQIATRERVTRTCGISF